MEPLDLSVQPPRAPREKMLGVYFLPRTIDKVRGHLPGGNPNGYIFRGFGMSGYLLKKIGVDPEALSAAVAAASTEADVEAWIAANAKLGAVEDLNARISSVTIGMQDENALAMMRSFYPKVDELPKSMPIFEVLEMDDARLFSKR